MLLRTAWLSAVNEARLLARDPVVLVMLLLAPVVIITVAGYSLGALYGDVTHARVLPVVDDDRNALSAELIAALRAAPGLRVELISDVAEARRRVAQPDGPALAVQIPAGTTAAVRAGRSADLVLFVDPAKRIEANAIEVRLARLCRDVGDALRSAAQARLDELASRLQRDAEATAAAVAAERARVQREIAEAGAAASAQLRAQLEAMQADAARRAEAALRASAERGWQQLEEALAERRTRVDALRARLAELRASEAALRAWLANVEQLAGRHADRLPKPPPFPALPTDAELAALTSPIPRPAFETPSLRLSPVVLPKLTPPALPLATRDGRPGELRFDRLPGGVGLRERAASPDASVEVNAFDQYVPGFGVTFLLIGMMLGVALTLFDERNWRTLERLEASGVPLAGLLLGKLATRFLVGVAQMVVLFAVGRALFGISLGREPIALLLPTIGISFAAASLGLAIPPIARTHDAVMPIGTMLSMAMSAVGGCWWPLGFEPDWMRLVARALPTTWTMQAYNDLMIRHAPWEAAIGPSLVALSIGAFLLAVGIAANLQRGSR